MMMFLLQFCQIERKAYMIYRIKSKHLIKKSSHLFRYYSGFTLVELLVVISIIALLLAILMPSLQKARNQAKQVACKQRLHQIGIAIAAYASENKGKYPIGNFFNYPYANYGDSSNDGNPNQSDDHFVGTDLKPYLTQVIMLLCPANEAFVKNGWVASYQKGVIYNDGAPNYSYFMGYYYFGNYSYDYYFWHTGSIAWQRSSMQKDEFTMWQKGLLYPDHNSKGRLKLFQDCTSPNDARVGISHDMPNSLYTDSSVTSNKIKDLTSYYRASVKMYHSW